MRVFLAIVMLIAASFGFGVVMANQHSDMLPTVRRMAIVNNIGGYEHDTGVFQITGPIEQEEVIAEIARNSMPTIKPKHDPGIFITAPTPIRKPPVPKKVQP